MPAAPCPYCGNQVMPYRRYALHLKSGAICASCGRAVRVRGYVIALVSGLLLAGAVLAYFILGERSLHETLIVLAVISLLSVAVDYTFWRRVGFDPAPQDTASPPPVSDGQLHAERDAGTPTGA